MSATKAAAPYYYVPGPSRWPIMAGMSLLATMIGASAWVNSLPWGMPLNLIGIAATVVVLYFWFGDAIAESEAGMYSKRIDTSFRWSMSWFIFSEVMFFGAFFGALFYARAVSMPWLADLDHKVIWPDFAAHWGNTGPAGLVEPFQTMFDLLPADRLPRLPRDHGRDHAGSGAVPPDEGPLQRREPLRVRRRRLVLALRRRRLARPVRRRLLAVRAVQGTVPAGDCPPIFSSQKRSRPQGPPRARLF